MACYPLFFSLFLLKIFTVKHGYYSDFALSKIVLANRDVNVILNNRGV